LNRKRNINTKKQETKKNIKKKKKREKREKRKQNGYSGVFCTHCETVPQDSPKTNRNTGEDAQFVFGLQFDFV
jgi:hypothetical protein